jgi:hypothetical protein
MLHVRARVQKIHAIFTAKPEIREDEIDLLVFENGTSLGKVCGGEDIIAIFQPHAQSIARGLFIVDNEENGKCHFDSGDSSKRAEASVRGKKRVMVVPLPLLLAMVILPP